MEESKRLNDFTLRRLCAFAGSFRALADRGQYVSLVRRQPFAALTDRGNKGLQDVLQTLLDRPNGALGK